MAKLKIELLCLSVAASLFMPFQASAGLFDWFTTLSPRAQKMKNSLEGFDQEVEKALQDYQVPGIAIGIVVDGHIIYSKGFGVKDIEKNDPVTPETLFGIGSCTKAFTSFLAGTLIEEGRFNWDDKVVDLLPNFRLYDDYATHHLTMRDLLTHRSGMPRHDYMWYNSTLTRGQVMNRLRFLEPTCEIRERYNYNNLMYLAAGYTMEQMMGKSWETLVSERILEPLGMKNTNFTISDMQKSSDYSSPHLEKNDTVKKISQRDFTAVGPSGSMNSNISDLTHWVEMQLNQGVYKEKVLIGSAMLQEMHSPQVVVSGTPEHKEAFLSTYGIGWGVISYRGNYLVSHDGGVDGFTSVINLLPNEGIGVIVLGNKNLSTLPRFLALEVTDRLLGLPSIDWLGQGFEAYKKGKEVVKMMKQNEGFNRKQGTEPSHELEEFVGDYEHPGYGTVNISLNDEGKLVGTFNRIHSVLDHWHYDVFVVSSESEDLFFSREGSKFTFNTNLSGEIDELIVPFEPSTTDIVFKKKPVDKFGSNDYLSQFTGKYVIYGVTVEIELRDNTLVSVIPGQPVFELIPTVENEFSVKSKTGYTVRFMLDPEGFIEEVLLIQPFGAFSAKPKR